MPARMFGFVNDEAAKPTAQEVQLRLQHFREITPRFTPKQASQQANRCAQCGTPFCQIHCPLQNNIPDWLMLAANGRMQEAYQASVLTNTFPEICGRICPQDRLCEGSCVIETSGHGAVTIGSVETFLTETAFEQGWVQPIRPELELPQSVGIVGSGPCALAAAQCLRTFGYQVHLYERQDRPGGLLMYGIPNFKLDKQVVQRRIDRIQDANVTISVNCEVGVDISLTELRQQHHALLIATGVYQPHALDLQVPPSTNLIPALDYLITSNRRNLGDQVPDSGRFNAHDHRVVVIGGGDTAMDCVRTAVRQGASSVTCLYRRDQANMPGSQTEIKRAIEEGINFEFQSIPVAFPEPSVITVQKTQLSTPDRTGRRSPQPIVGSEFTLDADMVITALGFIPEPIATSLTPHLQLQSWGTIQVGQQANNPKFMMTNIDGVFAGGDIVRGASLVVWAIRDGQDAAQAIHNYLSQQPSSHLADPK